MVTRSVAAIAALLLAAGCAKPPPEFEEVPPADELYEEGQKTIEGTRFLGFWPYVNYGEAIETFQAIIDNYPYSEYAVLAELAIADAYFEDEKYEEALSYYRDFTDLHPQQRIGQPLAPADTDRNLDGGAGLGLDITDLDIGDSLHVADLPVGEGVEILPDANLTVVTIVSPKMEIEVEEEVEAVEEEAEEGVEAEADEAETEE